jgi:IS30 family transposase
MARGKATQGISRWPHRAHWQSFFRRGGRSLKSPRAGQIPRQVRIDGRPEAANRREQLGDFEGDTIVSRGKRSGLVTLVDRKSRYLLAAKLKDRTAERTRRKTEKLLRNLAPELRQTITFDNGKESASTRRSPAIWISKCTSRIPMPLASAAPARTPID